MWIPVDPCDAPGHAPFPEWSVDNAFSTNLRGHLFRFVFRFVLFCVFLTTPGALDMAVDNAFPTILRGNLFYFVSSRLVFFQQRPEPWIGVGGCGSPPTG